MKEGSKFSLLLCRGLFSLLFICGLFKKKKGGGRKKKKLGFLRKRIFKMSLLPVGTVRRWFCWKRMGSAPANSKRGDVLLQWFSSETGLWWSKYRRTKGKKQQKRGWEECLLSERKHDSLLYISSRVCLWKSLNLSPLPSVPPQLYLRQTGWTHEDKFHGKFKHSKIIIMVIMTTLINFALLFARVN